MKLVRTFHPVGHGAFYTERFYDSDDHQSSPKFTMVYDCGRYEAAKVGWSSPQYKDWIENYVKLNSGLHQSDVVDVLFISHFHTDHINGIDFLLKYCDVKRIILPAITPLVIFEALVYNGISGADLTFVADFFRRCLEGDLKDKISQINILEEGEREVAEFSESKFEDVSGEVYSPTSFFNDSILWRYIPFYRVDSIKLSAIETELRRNFPSIFINGRIDSVMLLNEIMSKGVQQFKNIYESVFGQNKHNSYSLTLYSGLSPKKTCYIKCHLRTDCENGQEEVENQRYCSVNCLYMGDYEALNSGIAPLKNFYYSVWKFICIFQVPHHGSEKNSDSNLYNDRNRLCVISCDSHDKYNHPAPQVLKDIQSASSIPLIVTEMPFTKQEFIINLP